MTEATNNASGLVRMVRSHGSTCWEEMDSESFDMYQQDSDYECRELYTAPTPEPASPWISVEDRLPESGRTVLAFYLNSHGKGRRIRAMFVKRWTVEAEEFADPDAQCCEYSEQDDCYYTTEGWYELIDNWPDYASCAVIEGVITHWMPLPAAPEQPAKEQPQ